LRFDVVVRSLGWRARTGGLLGNVDVAERRDVGGLVHGDEALVRRLAILVKRRLQQFGGLKKGFGFERNPEAGASPYLIR